MSYAKIMIFRIFLKKSFKKFRKFSEKFIRYNYELFEIFFFLFSKSDPPPEKILATPMLKNAQVLRGFSEIFYSKRWIHMSQEKKR